MLDAAYEETCPDQQDDADCDLHPEQGRAQVPPAHPNDTSAQVHPGGPHGRQET
jgi:hypothetical protein